jgi:acyl-CoA thioesterase
VSTVPEDWAQGRTLYGGISASLCGAAARRAFTDLPPLRSALVAFIGPASGTVRMTPSVLRRGKSTAFIGVDLASEGAIAARTIFCYGAARHSALPAYAAMPMPAVPPPEACAPLGESDFRPRFTTQFDMHPAGGFLPLAGAPTPDLLFWVRHRDKAAGASDVALLAIGDVLPPGAITMFTRMAPISSMTWQFDLLSDAPVIPDGWLLARSTAETIGSGYSSQSMMLWNRDGDPIAAGRQSVAIFA